MFPATNSRATYSGLEVGVAILAKAPLPGLAKTRLILRLGAEGAANLQRWLLRSTVLTALKAGVGPVTLWCAPDTRHHDFEACRAYGPLLLRQQPAGDLGERMHAAVTGSSSPMGCLVIGTDCPMLTLGYLRHAAETLVQNDAVVVPAEDGGYVLIGLRMAEPDVFNGIDWGSDRVMRQTRQRFDLREWSYEELETLWDIDRPEDYERLLDSYPEIATLATECKA